MAESRRFGALPEVTDDLRAIRLENEKLGTLIIQKLADLRAGRITGQPLENLPWVGDLSDCRKIYVGLEFGRPTHRIVYSSHDDGVIEVIQVIAVGEREALAVYLDALRRLGRAVGGDPS
jgi:hypothetical protein